MARNAEREQTAMHDICSTNKGRQIYLLFFLIPFYLLHVAELSGDERILGFFLGIQKQTLTAELHMRDMSAYVVFISFFKVAGRQQMSAEIYSVFHGCNCRVMAPLSQQSWK